MGRHVVQLLCVEDLSLNGIEKRSNCERVPFLIASIQLVSILSFLFSLAKKTTRLKRA